MLALTSKKNKAAGDGLPHGPLAALESADAIFGVWRPAESVPRTPAGEDSCEIPALGGGVHEIDILIKRLAF